MLGRHLARARHEVRFGTREIVFLSLAFLLIWGLTFFLGMLVGRELSAPRPGSGRSRQAAVVPAEPEKTEKKATQQEHLTFYQALTAPTAELPPAKKGVVEERMVVKEQRSSGQGTAPPVAAPFHGTASAESASPARRWTVQVSSFRSRALAEDLREKLAAKGYDAYLVAVETDDGRVRYRVRVGSYATRGEADRVAEHLRGERNLNPFVTTRTR